LVIAPEDRRRPARGKLGKPEMSVDDALKLYRPEMKQAA
jgi:hypothetical protein